MGFSFFSRKKKKEEVLFDNFDSWLSNQKKDFGDTKVLSKGLDSLLVQLISGLEEKILVLEECNLEDRKERGRIKQIVLRNKESYLSAVRMLIKSLDGISEDSFFKKEKEIKELINNFYRKSNINYERATILIGNEIGDVKKTIQFFGKEVNSLLKENSVFINRLMVLEKVFERYQHFNNLLNEKKETETEIKEQEKQRLLVKEKLEKNDQKISAVLSSEKYLKRKENILEKEKMVQEIKNCSKKIRGLIDFKKLKNVFHSNNKAMSIISSYVDDFIYSLNQQRGSDLLSLIEEANISTVELREKITNYLLKKEEFEKIIIPADETKSLYEEKEKIKLGILSKKEENEKFVKRLEKIIFEINETKEGLVIDLDKINVQLIL